MSSFSIAALLRGVIAWLTLTAVDSTRVPSPADRELIIGGIDSHPDRYPYFVRLDWMDEFICGGTLITQDFVLTAAHCLEDLEEELTVTIDAHTFNETSPTLTRVVTRTLSHPSYDYWTSDINDVALLQIERPENTDTAPVLPTIQLNTDRSIPAKQVSVTTIGLGAFDVEKETVPAFILQEVELKVVDDDLCDIEYDGELHQKSMICAMDANQDSCSGDSGGPLLILGEDVTTEESSLSAAWENDVQVGVVSFGLECAHETIPGVYADVAYVYPWIESQLCRYSSDPPTGCRNVTDSFFLEEDECRDYPGAFYVNWFFRFQRCEWLAGKQGDYCSPDKEAWLHCPFTCHSCTYEPEDEHVGLEPFSEESAKYEEGSDVGIMIVLVVAVPIVVGCLGACLIGFQIWVICLCRGRRQLRSELLQLKSAAAPPPEMAQPPSSNIIQGSVILR